MDRRQFLKGALTGASSLALSCIWQAAAASPPGSAGQSADAPVVLRAVKRTIEVNGRAVSVLGLLQPNGTPGMATLAGRFRVHLENHLGSPTLIHWHGLTPPYGQDGVPDLPQPLLPNGQSYDYDFPLETPGTHWMHAHTLQEQQLLAAPLIVTGPGESARDEQSVVVLFHDFSFKSPEELLAGLRGGSGAASTPAHGAMPSMPGHSMSGGSMAGSGGAAPGMAMDINDIDYDAYLANDRTLDDPQVFRVERNGQVRLRLINGATATAFWVDLGELTGEAIAVDGNPIVPIAGRRFPLGMGQRLDIRIRVPNSAHAWTIFARREGAVEQTGFILATREASVRRVVGIGAQAMPQLDHAFEARLRATRPLAERAADRRETVALGGDMAAYVWMLDGRPWGDHRPLPVRTGERVELTLRNQSMMGHPMHLHGHHFQVVAINGQRSAGAVRDTVWVAPMQELTIAFDALNPGRWAFHCHHLYHMATGMMTMVEYAT